MDILRKSIQAEKLAFKGIARRPVRLEYSEQKAYIIFFELLLGQCNVST